MSTAWADKLYGMVRNLLMNSADIKGDVASVYVGELAEQRRPKFPCITMRVTSAGSIAYNTADGSLRVWVWSKKRASEATRIYSAVEIALFNQRTERTGAIAVLKTADDMLEIYEQPTQMYSAVGTFRFRVINNTPSL